MDPHQPLRTITTRRTRPATASRAGTKTWGTHGWWDWPERCHTWWRPPRRTWCAKPGRGGGPSHTAPAR
eukprot:12694322-Alexandrium_andersonii.AAC.1